MTFFLLISLFLDSQPLVPGTSENDNNYCSLQQANPSVGFDDSSAPSTPLPSSSVRPSARLPAKRKLIGIHEEMLAETKRANAKSEEQAEVANKLLFKANEIAEMGLELQRKLADHICSSNNNN